MYVHIVNFLYSYSYYYYISGLAIVCLTVFIIVCLEKGFKSDEKSQLQELKCHSNWKITKAGMSLKFECHSNWNVTQIGMSLKLECHSNWNVTQIGMSHKFLLRLVSLKYECHSNWKT